MQSKICSQCGEIKSIEEFYKHIKSKDGHDYICKKCSGIRGKEWYKKNSELTKKRADEWHKNNPDKFKEIGKKYYLKNREKRLAYSKKYHQENPECKRRSYKRNKEEIRIKSKKWIEDNLERYREFQRGWAAKRRKEDVMFKINEIIKGAIYRSLRQNKANNHWENLVGYNLQDLIKHLELQFRDGMTWENQGKWHIDHIIPISLWKFNSYNDREFKQCWALANLQPLWAEENLRKGNKVENT